MNKGNIKIENNDYLGGLLEILCEVAPGKMKTMFEILREAKEVDVELKELINSLGDPDEVSESSAVVILDTLKEIKSKLQLLRIIRL